MDDFDNPSSETAYDNLFGNHRQARSGVSNPAYPSENHQADFKNALTTADGNQFNLAGAENRVNPRYYPEKTEAMHQNLAFAAGEGRQLPDYSQTRIDSATRNILSEHYLENNQSALNTPLYREIASHPGGRLPGIAATGAYLGAAETAENIVQSAYQGMIHDPSIYSIDPVNAIQMNKNDFPGKALSLDPMKKPLKKTMQHLQNHPDFQDKTGNRTPLGDIASLTGNVAQAAPGTALAFLGGPALRTIVLASGNQAVRQSAYETRQNELNQMDINTIRRVPEYEARFQRLIVEHSSVEKAEDDIRHAIAKDYANRVQGIHGLLTVGGVVFSINSNEAANTLFAQYMRSLSLATLNRMAPPKIADRISEWRQGEDDNEEP